MVVRTSRSASWMVLVPPIMEGNRQGSQNYPSRAGSANRSLTPMCHRSSSRLPKCPRPQSRDRTLQRAVEQILDVPVPEMVNRLLEVPKIIPHDRILQRTVKQPEATQVPQSETSGARRTAVLTFTGKFKRRFADIDRSQRIRTGDIGQTARRAGALNYARSPGIVHFCNHEVWCRR